MVGDVGGRKKRRKEKVKTRRVIIEKSGKVAAASVIDCCQQEVFLSVLFRSFRRKTIVLFRELGCETLKLLEISVVITIIDYFRNICPSTFWDEAELARLNLSFSNCANVTENENNRVLFEYYSGGSKKAYDSLYFSLLVNVFMPKISGLTLF
ncbi:hypothetical protein LOAG_08141 [Loa loa]|uniref:Uncharacterized protein n=1 Tax=Loa loa TaxID=7209 RepID=A0A1S0TUJ3_LOALO|nr:hypothetical protein LOAG_08141 [Loa loa]EFO20348.1 hypothetical protein LOAG_08141 [Loa loa]